MLSSNSTNLLTVIVVLLMAYFLYKNQTNPIKNEGNLTYNENLPENLEDSDSDSEAESEDNSNANGEYKTSNYAESARASGGDWDAFFDSNNKLIKNSNTANDQFTPNDSSNGGFASFNTEGSAPCSGDTKCNPEDLFDVDKYLPKEQNDDWFEVQPEPVSVKNRHLINVVKPIGVDTIGSSGKNASRDLRGNVACPKFVVSPWQQSSIEPDLNMKSLA